MQYLVQLTTNETFMVDGNAFHVTPGGNAVIFYASRMTNTGDTDQWGHTRRRRDQVAVAMFTGVASIMEVPEVPEPEVVFPEAIPLAIPVGTADNDGIPLQPNPWQGNAGQLE